MEKKNIYYLVPVLLAVILFASNFLSTDIFNNSTHGFTVWFILSIFAFACGWLIDRTLGWNYGGKIVFAVIVAMVFTGMFMIVLFSSYFGVNDLVTENLILYTLRNIVLGTMAFFGMALSEVIFLHKGHIEMEDREPEESQIDISNEEAEFLVKQAKLKAEKIIFEAEKQSQEMIDKKKRIIVQLKEFIHIERELIKKYEDEDNN
ncbi:MAG: hypothetical protein KAQ90_02905 [Melioribacteraceae bacterium]|nr:hypothetical protein [Melioribacteraceae bacterium]